MRSDHDSARIAALENELVRPQSHPTPIPPIPHPFHPSHAPQAAKQAQVVISNLQSDMASAAAAKDSIKTAAGRQLIERRDALLHRAVQDAIAIITQATTTPEPEQLILCVVWRGMWGVMLAGQAGMWRR